MVAMVVEVCALADGFVAARENAADGGIRTGEGSGFLRELEGAREVGFDLWGQGHAASRIAGGAGLRCGCSDLPLESAAATCSANWERRSDLHRC